MVRNLASVMIGVLLALVSVEVDSSVLKRREQIPRKLNRSPIRLKATELWQWRRFENGREHDAPVDRLEYERREADYRPYRYYPMPDDVFGFGK